MKNSESNEQSVQASSQADFSWRTEFYAWAVVVVLSVAFTFSMIDRMLLTLLVQPIKSDFGLSDTGVSLLHGLAFTILYVFVGLPMGWLADRFSRRTIAGVSMFVWSLATATCGLATNFAQLFAARVSVGVGEAGLSPAANSLISDYFPPERLARPIAYWSIGGIVGGGLAYIGGGAVVDVVSEMGALSFPLIGEIRPWQMAFFVVGLPGLLFAFLFAFVREPVRIGRASARSAPIGQTAAFFWRHLGFFAPHFMASAFAAMALLSLNAWMPTYLIRMFGVTPGQAGGAFGIAVIVGGVSGMLVGGHFSERLAARGVEAAHIVVARLLVLIAIVPACGATLAPGMMATLVLSGVGMFGLAAAIALAPVALQVVVPNEMRGQIYAVYLMTLSLLGYTVGPTLVALVTDFVFADDAKVGRSISIVAAIGAPLSLLCFTLSKRAYRQSFGANRGA